MLIVNADDMGASRTTTDPVLDCFGAGTITSTTAMVWMPDSERAAESSRQRALPVGLHLNLTAPFGADAVPDDIRDRQLGLTRHFGRESWRAETEVRVPTALIAAAIADQLKQFREQFGEPTHIDGHHHIHLHPAVLSQLPPSLPIRPPLTGAPASLAQRWRLRRCRSADVCLALSDVHPALGGDGLEMLEPAARGRVVEVMTHPLQPTERQALDSPEWVRALAAIPLGSYRELAR